MKAFRRYIYVTADSVLSLAVQGRTALCEKFGVPADAEFESAEVAAGHGSPVFCLHYRTDHPSLDPNGACPVWRLSPPKPDADPVALRLLGMPVAFSPYVPEGVVFVHTSFRDVDR